MSFHPEKCEVIQINTKKKPIIFKYTLHGHTLYSVPQIKYLEVNISQDLKWNSHINSVSSKENETLGFLKRNLKINSQTIKEKAYKSIVRPKLEYCNTVWYPKCIKNPKEADKTNHRLVYQIEMVQRRAARWVTGRCHNTSSVSDMLGSLDCIASKDAGVFFCYGRLWYLCGWYTQAFKRFLKAGKAADPDRLKPVLLKEFREEIAPIIQVIFERSITTGKLPTEWCRAQVSPIFKKGDTSSLANYRPISLTCIFCKVLEHIMASHLVKHLDKHDLLYDLQHGFREKRSCETQFTMLIENLAWNTSAGKQTNFVLLDFSKAFVKVIHSKLIWKLHHYGIRGNALSWIRAFLGNRSQTVVLEGEESGSVAVTSVVPQGLVLGPILFLVYINDLPEELASQVHLFADDTAVYLTVGGSEDQTVLQTDLDRLVVWERQWGMEFNHSKCQVVRVTTAKTVLNTVYNLHGQILEVVTSARYLGVDISTGLSWGSHIDRITGNANRTLGYIRRNIKTKNQKVKETAYNTLVHPQLEYAAPVWEPFTKDKRCQLQRRAARWTISNYDYMSQPCLSS